VIGYGIGSGYWNHGYEAEAVRRFLEYLFREKGMRTVYASFFTGNDASRRVLEKCGMTFDHFTENELTCPGTGRNLTYYAVHRKADVILLNGPSSAGKSSIAKALRRKLRGSENSVIVSLDDYLQMSADEPIWEDDVFAVMPRMCESISAALQDGKTVIIDHVIASGRIWRSLINAVSGFQMKTVLVSCDAETLRLREKARGDRCAGSAEASLRYLVPKTGYDVCVDSSEAGTAALAQEIIRSLDCDECRKDG
jgi:chloramphenicol 3-O phosphotransferase